MSADNEYNFPFRKNYELRIMALWLAISACCFICPLIFDVPKSIYHLFTFITAFIGLILGRKGIEIYIRKSRLKGYPLEFLEPSSDEAINLFQITNKEIINEIKKIDSLFFGWGGEWTQTESQLIFDILKRNVPELIGKQRVSKGDGYIHGLIEKETVLRFPIEHANGHTLITGASGSGKSCCFGVLLKQLIYRDEVVIFFDPKGDKDIKEISREACEEIGKPDKFLYWHPAFPRDCVRLNPLKNFTRSSELAARVTALLPDDGDSFYLRHCQYSCSIYCRCLPYYQ
ncbi:helicase HerA domain-containing protein [Psychromonas sp. KJ10-2]|uniref:helicase HerA domain-containing protein n=1 Tax=Psychromonas sp. KJ10-2 TaxID=3391822 RepID=UPI0039B5AA3E